MQLTSVITPAQSREARRELGLSQADVAGTISVNRVYVSDFESGNLVRLTKVQLRKLRTFYESKIEEARANGDDITVIFGEPEADHDSQGAAAPKNLAPSTSTRNIARRVFEIDDAIPDDVVESTKSLVGECVLDIMPLFNQPVESGFLSDFDDKTEKLLQQVFWNLSLVGLLFIQMTSPRVFRAGPPKEDMRVVYDVVFETFKGHLIEAGLIVEDQAGAGRATKADEVAQ